MHVEALMKVVYPSEVTPYPKVPKKNDVRKAAKQGILAYWQS